MSPTKRRLGSRPGAARFLIRSRRGRRGRPRACSTTGCSPPRCGGGRHREQPGERQLHGGVAFELGSAVLDGFRYSDAGTPTMVSFVDWLVTMALGVARVEWLIRDPEPADNLLGTHGAVEIGPASTVAALTSAVAAPLGNTDVIAGAPVGPDMMRVSVDHMRRAVPADGNREPA